MGDIEKYEFVGESLERVSRCICRCQLLEKLYLGGNTAATAQFKSALVRLYGLILLYLLKAKGFFDKKRSMRMISSAFRDKTEFEECVDDISKGLDDVNQYAELICREDECFRYSELQNYLQEFDAPLKRIEMQIQEVRDDLEETRRRNILKWMSDTEKIPYMKHHKENRRQILKGTGEWLLTDGIFKEWNDDSASSLLWLHGIPGSGKSKLTSLVIQNALEASELGRTPRPAFFYCSRNAAEPLRAEPEAILTSIARQLATLTPASDILPPVVEMYKQEEAQGNASGSLDLDGAQELILKLIDVSPYTTIIIDALDECSKEGRGCLLDFIKTALVEASSLVKFFISSREDGDIVFNLQRFPNCRISSKKNRADIEAFVKSETRRLIRSGSLLRNSQQPQELEDTIVAKVSDDAHGMFRWASLQLQNLTTLKTDPDIKERLGKIPPSLEQLYQEIYALITTNQGVVSREVARNVFSLLLLARHDLKLAAFLALVRPTQHHLALQEVLDICCNLVVLDETLLVLRFAHLSVREFLETLPEYNSAKSHSAISLCCLKSVHDWKISGLNPTSWNFMEGGGYTIQYLVYHIDKAGVLERQKNTFLEKLAAFLQTRDLSRFKHPKGSIWQISKPPDYVDPEAVCIFNACAFGFYDVVDTLLSETLAQLPSSVKGDFQGLGKNENQTRVTDIYRVINFRHLKQAFTPATYSSLGDHAILHENFEVLQFLLKRQLYTLPEPLVLKAAQFPWMEESGILKVMLDIRGLDFLTTSVVKDAVIFAGKPGDRHAGGTLLVQYFLERGLKFQVNENFLFSITLRSVWTLESILLLIEADPGYVVSVHFLEQVIRSGHSLDTQLERLLQRCDPSQLTQIFFVEASLRCNTWNPIRFMMDINSDLRMTEELLTQFFHHERGRNVLLSLFQLSDKEPSQHLPLTQYFLYLAASHQNLDSILVRLLSGINSGLYESLEITQTILELMAKNCLHWETVKNLLALNPTVSITEIALVEAAKNPSVENILGHLLALPKTKHSQVTQRVLETTAEYTRFPLNITILLDRFTGFCITEEMLEALIRNPNAFNRNPVDVLQNPCLKLLEYLEQRFEQEDYHPSPALLESAVRFGGRHELVDCFFRTGKGLHVTDEILDIATTKQDSATLQVLVRWNPSLKVSSEALSSYGRRATGRNERDTPPELVKIRCYRV